MKKHFEVLDGLRGTAAVLVVIFHLVEAAEPDPALNIMHHAYLAVDFFFMLSGFVIAYAYDGRWKTMTIRDFFTIRLIRLHPLVILSIVIGALGYWLDPFIGHGQEATVPRMMIAIVAGMLLIPTPSLPNHFEETHSLNGPSWTLLQEYLANIAYAFFGPRLSRNALVLVTGLSAAALAYTAIRHGDLQGGWGWSNYKLAPVRVAFPFAAGLLLFRIKARIKIPMAYPLLSLLLMIVFTLPWFRYNGAFEAACIIIVFPFIMAAGAGSEVTGKLSGICRFFGRISYPIYIMHFPFIYIYTHWLSNRHPSKMQAIEVGAGLFVFFMLLAWASLKYYDEPVRAWLTAWHKKKAPAK